MNKTIAIVASSEYFDEYSLYKKGCGGSETWALQLGYAFTNIGYNVIIFVNDMQYHIATTFNNIEFANYQDILLILAKRKIDYVIISRIIDTLLYHYLVSENIPFYYMIHDILPLIRDENGANTINVKYEYRSYLENVKNIVLLSDFHLNNFIDLFPEEKFINKCRIIPNAIDFNLFKGINILNTDRDNSILVSSTLERGLPQIIRDIAPLVRKEIPDFKVYVAGYNDYKEYKELAEKYKDYVVYLGNLSKTDLYKEMVKHKIWFYPGCFPETFCITAIENVFCNVEVVSSMNYGLLTTLYPMQYNKVDVNIHDFGTYNFGDDIENCIDKKFTKTTNKKFADAIINAIKTYNDPYKVNVRRGYIDWVANTYNWDRVAKMWDYLFLTTK